MILNQVEVSYIDIAPYLGNEFRKKIEMCCNWLDSELEIPLKGRIPEYIKNIEGYPRYRGGFSDEMYYCLQSFFEMSQIVSLNEYLSDDRTKDFLETIKKSVYGGAFRDKIESAEKDAARNYLFELSVASDLRKIGLDIELSSRADITIDSLKAIIECKRVHSVKKIIARVKRAINQSKEDIPHEGSLFVFVDITGVFDSSKSIMAVNETGFPYSMAPPMEESQLNDCFKEEIEELVADTILKCSPELSALCQGHVSGIILNYDAIGFHVNIAQERLAVGNSKYLICNDSDMPKEMLKGYFDKFSQI